MKNIMVGQLMIIGIIGLAFIAVIGIATVSGAEEKKNHWEFKCRDAGGVVLITHGGRYCMKKELFIQMENFE